MRDFIDILRSVFLNTMNVRAGRILVLAGRAMQLGGFTVGDLALFVAYLESVSEFTVMIGEVWTLYKQSDVSLKRLIVLLQALRPRRGSSTVLSTRAAICHRRLTRQKRPTTARDNILMGQPEDRVDLPDAICLAVMEQDLGELEDGLDTVIGAKGVKISGGQRRHTAAARMFVRAPELLVFAVEEQAPATG